MRKAAAPAAPPDATALLSSLRGVAAQLIAAKQAGGETSQLASDGSALLMEMRRQEHAVLEAMEGPLQEVSAAKRKMETAEAELHGLRYHKRSCVRGLAECNEMSLELPVGLVSEAELKQLAPELVTADSAHQLQLQRLAVECKERQKLCSTLAAAKTAKAESSEQAAARKVLYSSVATQLGTIISAAATLQATALWPDPHPHSGPCPVVPTLFSDGPRPPLVALHMLPPTPLLAAASPNGHLPPPLPHFPGTAAAVAANVRQRARGRARTAAACVAVHSLARRRGVPGGVGGAEGGAGEGRGDAGGGGRRGGGAASAAHGAALGRRGRASCSRCGARRLRSAPPAGGVSTYVKEGSTALDGFAPLTIPLCWTPHRTREYGVLAYYLLTYLLAYLLTYLLTF